MSDDFSVANVEGKIAKIMEDKPGELGLEECRDNYLQEIFDWSDYWTENWSGNETDPEAKAFVTNNLIELWKSYAFFEAKNKQFKKAVDVFKKATEDVIVGVAARLFEVFAEYYVEKSKPASAQKVLIEGLCKQKLSAEDNAELWQYLLEFTKKITQKEDLTLELLYEEIVTAGIEMSQTLSFPPGCDQDALKAIKVNRLIPKSAPVVDVAESKTAEGPSSKEATMETALKIEPMQLPAPMVKTESVSVSSSVPAPAVPAPAAATISTPAPISIRWFEDNTFSKTQPVSSIATSLAPVWTAEQILLAFQQVPPSIFCAPTQDPIVEGVKQLSSEEKHDLEVFLTTNVTPEAENNGHAKNMLNLVEALWYQHALRERHFDAWLTLLSHAQRREEFTVTSTQYFNAEQARQAEVGMRHRQEQAQRLLQAYIHKCRFDLLLEELGVLTTLKMPRCTPVLLQQWEQWGNQSRKAANTFIQQQKQAPSSNRKSAKDFLVDDFGVLRQEIVRIQRLAGALLSLRASHLLAQGRVSSDKLLNTLLNAQQPSYPTHIVTAMASAVGVKRDLSAASTADSVDDDEGHGANSGDMSPDGSQRRKTKRRRSVAASSSSSSEPSGPAPALNSYNMPNALTLSDVAREQMRNQQSR